MAQRTPRIGREPLDSPQQVRGVLAERVIVSAPLDPWLGLRAASSHASLSERTLTAAIRHPDPAQRLPACKVAGQYLIQVSALDAWIQRHRVTGPDLGAMVEDIVTGLDGSPHSKG